MVWRRTVRSVGPKSRSKPTKGSGARIAAPISVTKERTALDAGLVVNGGQDFLSLCTLLLGTNVVTFLDQFVVRHEGSCPLHNANTNTEHAQRNAEAQQQVLQAQLAGGLRIHHVVDRSVDSNTEVRDEEQN